MISSEQMKEELDPQFLSSIPTNTVDEMTRFCAVLGIRDILVRI